MSFTEAELLKCVPGLKGFAYKLLRNPTDREDLLQDTLARAWAKRHLYVEERGGGLQAWCCMLLHNQYVNRVRRSVREAAVLEAAGDVGLHLRHPCGDADGHHDCQNKPVEL